MEAKFKKNKKENSLNKSESSDCKNVIKKIYCRGWSEETVNREKGVVEVWEGNVRRQTLHGNNVLEFPIWQNNIPI